MSLRLRRLHASLASSPEQKRTRPVDLWAKSLLPVSRRVACGLLLMTVAVAVAATMVILYWTTTVVMSLAPDISLPPHFSRAAAESLSRERLGGATIHKISIMRPTFEVLFEHDLGQIEWLTGAAYSPSLEPAFTSMVKAEYVPVMRVKPVTVHFAAESRDGIAPSARQKLKDDARVTDDEVDALAAELAHQMRLNPMARSVTHFIVQGTESGSDVPVVDGDDRHGPVAAIILPLPLNAALEHMERLRPFAQAMLLAALRKRAQERETPAKVASLTVAEYYFERVPGQADTAPANRVIYMRLVTAEQARKRKLDVTPFVRTPRDFARGAKPVPAPTVAEHKTTPSQETLESEKIEATDEKQGRGE